MIKKRILGITALSHDASIAVIEEHEDHSEVVFAAHSERSSRAKNYKWLTQDLVNEALSYGDPHEIAFYERPFLKKTRQAYAGQWDLVMDSNRVIHHYLFNEYPQLNGIPIRTVSHHLSHAATGALTSPYDEACVVVADAIGEWECLTIWKYTAPCTFKKLYSTNYPNSLGLFYTAMTHRVDLKPNEDEYILMGMAAYGEPKYAEEMDELFFKKDEICKLRTNLHNGCRYYRPGADHMDIAASAQQVIEWKIEEVMNYARTISGSDNLVYMGGVALNCVANSNLNKYFSNTWICPNPGDAGSAVGCAGYIAGKKINWKGPYLGHEIKGDYPVEGALEALLDGQIIGIANGRAEFGPRALGNRSLVADPRGPDIKDKMNEIKKRQKFRPFAPMILEHFAHEYFDMPVDSSPYMQYVAKCKYPKDFPAIVHADGTSRVQTVTEEQHPKLYELLLKFYNKTGCPMLVNTSLNIKGQPIVDDENDAVAFEEHYGVKVFTKET